MVVEFARYLKSLHQTKQFSRKEEMGVTEPSLQSNRDSRILENRCEERSHGSDYGYWLMPISQQFRFGPPAYSPRAKYRKPSLRRVFPRSHV